MEAFLDIEKLNELVASRHLNRRQHPERPELWLYNYTVLTQFDRIWNETTLQCRGIVVDDTGKIVARPLSKFFNYDELDASEVPWHLPFEVTTKLDGSMFLIQRLEDGLHIYATRGSFESDQAKVGWQLFEKKYHHVGLDPKYTYVFEVIYPENRIVVDYGDLTEIVLLAVIRVEDGFELPHDQWPVELTWVQQLEVSTSLLVDEAADALKALETRNAEGFVVRFESGMRVKIKFEEYKRLHRIVTGVSTKTIWEYLRDGRSLEEIIENTPDEFNEFVRTTRVSLQAGFDRIKADADSAYAAVAILPTRKEQAIAIMSGEQKELAPIVFRMLDGCDYARVIWQRLQPEYRQPFMDRE